MTTTRSAPASTELAMSEFDRTTSRWGRITMITGLLVSIAGPLYLVFAGGLDIAPAQLWVAFAAVAATFGIIWIVEPLTYYPILGPAAMYQAFMIGNISNKLLPAALIAQTSARSQAPSAVSWPPSSPSAAPPPCTWPPWPSSWGCWVAGSSASSRPPS
jgi:hypothetical protein